MKKKFNILLSLIIAASFIFVFNGCDEFNNFPVNFPISKTIVASGSNTTISGSGPICLNKDSQTFQDYQDKIKGLKFIQAAFRIDSVTASGISAPNLKGDIVITLNNQNNLPLFSVKISNINPSDYINKVLVLSLTQNQIQAMNAYISNLNNTCFYGSMEVQNITGGNPPFTIVGVIDMVFEADTEL